MRGVSPIIATMLMLLLVIGISAMVAPWAFNLVYNITTHESGSATTDIICNDASVDFNTEYGENGVSYNFTDQAYSLSVMVINTGTVNLYNFSIEIEVNSTESGLRRIEYNVTSTTQKPQSQPLKPGRTALLTADITEDLNGTLRYVKVLNERCKSRYVEQQV